MSILSGWTRAIALLLGISFSVAAGSAYAAYPDEDSLNLAIERYNLLLETDRSSCGYYANPNTLQIFKTVGVRTVSVIRMVNRDRPGTACNGVFEVRSVGVQCDTQEISYTYQPTGTWEPDWQRNESVARQVCDLPEIDLNNYDRDFFELARSQYQLFVSRDRSSCGYYANPNTLNVEGDDRTISVLVQRDAESGTICRGVFQFRDLGVRCATGEVAYDNRRWVRNAEVADRVCTLP
jgi:hypothetical protein